jgi:hypothetical protein
MNRGRMNGKRKKKRDARKRTPQDVNRLPAFPEQLTGTVRVMLDNTVPGGVRYEHTPGKVP